VIEVRCFAMVSRSVGRRLPLADQRQAQRLQEPNDRVNGRGCRVTPSRPTRCGCNCALAYNLANFLRTLALPPEVAQWSMTTLRERLVKIGAKIVRHGRSISFQMAEVMVPRQLFEKILTAIAALRPLPPARC
jgi:hypothetical protein